MEIKDINWLIWGAGACIFFGVWQESIYAGTFMFYGLVFGLMTIARWNERD